MSELPSWRGGSPKQAYEAIAWMNTEKDCHKLSSRLEYTTTGSRFQAGGRLLNLQTALAEAGKGTPPLRAEAAFRANISYFFKKSSLQMLDAAHGAGDTPATIIHRIEFIRIEVQETGS